MAAILAAIIVWVAALVGCEEWEKPTPADFQFRPIRASKLAAIRIKGEIEGRVSGGYFLLFGGVSGSIGEEEYIHYMIDEGGMTCLRKVEAKLSCVVETSKRGPEVVHEYRKANPCGDGTTYRDDSGRWTRPISCVPSDVWEPDNAWNRGLYHDRYVFYVPPGSVVRDLSVDLGDL